MPSEFRYYVASPTPSSSFLPWLTIEENELEPCKFSQEQHLLSAAASILFVIARLPLIAAVPRHIHCPTSVSTFNCKNSCVMPKKWCYAVLLWTQFYCFLVCICWSDSQQCYLDEQLKAAGLLTRMTTTILPCDEIVEGIIFIQEVPLLHVSVLFRSIKEPCFCHKQ